MIELYLLAALMFIYIVTLAANNYMIVRKIWTLAFMASFSLMAVSLAFLRISGQEVMLASDNMNWYYFLYVFGALAMATGIINVWIYRHQLWQLIKHPENAEETAKE